MPSVALVVPGPLTTRTGGYEYDRRIAGGLRALGWRVDVRELPGAFPQPSDGDRLEAARVLASLDDGATAVIDGLAFGALPEDAEREAERLRLVALVHHPLALETGLPDGVRHQLERTERRALAAARQVVVSSPATRVALHAYGVAPDRIAVVVPGTDPAPLARGSGSDIVHMVCVGSIVPRKGHELLLRSLASLPARNWRLRCVGGERDEATGARLRMLLRDLDLGDRVSFEGEADGPAMEAYYSRADLFVLPTLYEGYGMAVAEAVARGLPVISTATGAIPEIVPDEAGVLVSPGDGPALERALASVLNDAALRARLAAGARRARTSLPTWNAAAMRMASVLAAVARG